MNLLSGWFYFNNRCILRKRHEGQFVNDQQFVGVVSSLTSISSCARGAAVVNRTRKPFWQAARPSACSPGLRRAQQCPPVA